MIILLKPESDSPSFDQKPRAILVERDTAEGWYGRPLNNPRCPTLLYPKFAWVVVTTTR